ncbi:MAG: HDOD domain-containing protein [Candidatus Schekmanbacteria bacterium]|nr:MAG: HDOD domain-containing protein [Candidatus Schekmanbacteria bacterium]
MDKNEVKKKIEEHLETGEELPFFSVTVKKLLELTEDPETSLSEIVSAMDTSVAATTLKMANSVYFGGSSFRNIKSLEHAIMVIGFDSLRELAFNASLISMFKEDDENVKKNIQAHLEHCFQVAISSKLLASLFNYENKAQCYVAGLLHDIGKLAIERFFRNESAQIKELQEKEGISDIEAERRILGLDHMEIGGIMGDKWNLPESIVEAIRCHSNIEKAEIDKKFTCIIYLSDELCKKTEGIFDFRLVNSLINNDIKEFFPQQDKLEDDYLQDQFAAKFAQETENVSYIVGSMLK